MKTLILLNLAILLARPLPGQEPAESESAVAFRAIDLYLASSVKPLAAYQVELFARRGAVKFVGIEGGEHAAFSSPPFYDPKAMQRERVVLAAYNTGSADDVPKGKTRVATLHFQIPADEESQFVITVHAAATVDGKIISVEATQVERKKE